MIVGRRYTQLRTMLDIATYRPGPLARPTRLAIERVRLVVAEPLV